MEVGRGGSVTVDRYGDQLSLQTSQQWAKKRRDSGVELSGVVDVVVTGEGASDCKTPIVKQDERDGNDDGLLGRILVVRSKIDEDSLGFGVILSRLAEGAGKVCCSRRGQIIALDDERVGSVGGTPVAVEEPRVASRLVSNGGWHVLQASTNSYCVKRARAAGTSASAADRALRHVRLP